MEGGERDEPFLAGFGLGGSSEGGAEILTAAEEGRAKKDMSPWAMLDGAAATATMAGGRRSGERETLGERRAGQCLEAVAGPPPLSNPVSRPQTPDKPRPKHAPTHPPALPRLSRPPPPPPPPPTLPPWPASPATSPPSRPPSSGSTTPPGTPSPPSTPLPPPPTPTQRRRSGQSRARLAPPSSQPTR